MTISANPPVVFIVDDEAAVRNAVANLLASEGYETAAFESTEAFFAHWQPSDCGCLLLDIQFPGMSGLDFQERFNAAAFSLPIIFMTGHADVPSSVRGLKAGAVDFLTKPFSDTDLLAAVSIALARDRLHRIAELESTAVADRYALLTLREKEVMELVTRGLMNKQVAGELGLSEITVKVHRGTMMRKMQLRTLADLVRAAEVLKSESD